MQSSNSTLDGAISEVSSSGLPPPLIDESEYESFVCRDCVLSCPTIRKWAGTKGAMMVTRASNSEPWEVLNVDSDTEENLSITEDKHNTSSSSTAGMKRPYEASSSEVSEEQKPKRVRTTTAELLAETQSPCLAPPLEERGQNVLSLISASPPNYDLGSGDIFFASGFRSRWCRCHKVLVFSI